MTGSANNTAHPGPQWSPLSCSQQRLWLFSRLSPDSTAYNISGMVWLDGELDVPALQDTMRYILARQEITNARFAEIDGVAWQRPVPRSPDDIPLVDLSNDADPLARAYQEAHQLNARPFDLEAESPARFRLVRLSATRHAILVSMHHIIGDAWSLGVFLQEFLFSYSAFRSGVQPAVPPLKKQYVEWAENEAQWLKGESAASQLSYWTDTLEHEGEPLALPRLKQDAGASHPACCNDFSLSAGDNRKLKQLATQLDVSRFTVLLAAFQYLLARVSGQQQVRVGVPSANRKGSNQFLIGFFVNNLVIQGRVLPGMTVRDWVAQIHAALNGAKQHRDLPFDRVVDALCRSRDQGCHPLFQVAFNYRQQGKGMKLDLGNLTVTAEDVPVTETPFDLVLDAWPDTDGGLGLRLVHGEGVLSDDFARYLREAFVGLLQQWLHDSELALAESDVLPPADLARLQQWQQQGQDNWHWKSYPALFGAQAQRQKEAIALVHGDHRCTFAQLDACSNQLAQYLLQQGVTADEVIAVSFERGIAMIEAFLGVMKAGAAFLPLDPAYPSERLHYMLEDSGARWLLTASGLVSALPDVPGLKKVPLDSLSLQGFSSEPVGVNVHPDQLAYVIYTSGSTGKPKGVSLTHGGLSMHVQTIGKRYGMTPEDVELQFASISFDGAVERWTVPLAFGSRVVIRDQALWSAEKCCEVLQQEGVTIACFPPSYVGPLLDWIEQEKPALNVRSWTLGGEAFTRETFERMQQVIQPRRILNGYGPTETVITPLLWDAYAGDTLTSAYAPIGTAVGPRKLYVLDASLNRVPPGVAGELYIGNEVGLARGYHGRADLTAERFLPDPFGEPGERMYRTGDLVKFRDDGVMEYLGRVDQQVKIRGFRIELGEIESRLLAFDSIRDAAVVAQPSPTGDRLVGYIVPRHTEGARIDTGTILAELSHSLPDYMVPGQLMQLEALPLTPAGKVDRKALPAAQWHARTTGEAPQTDNEQTLATIWQDLLGMESVGRDDHFFALGGDSILALQVVSRARQQGLALTPKHLFEKPTLRALAAVAGAVTVNTASQQALDGPVGLLPIQQQFIEQQGLVACNQYLQLSLAQPFQLDALESALQLLVQHHDALRLRFSTENPAQAQAMPSASHALLQRCAPATSAEREQYKDALQRSLDPATGKLLQALYVEGVEGEPPQLLLTIHHLAVDGVSWRILLEDLLSAYQQYGQGGSASLPRKTHSVLDWRNALDDTLVSVATQEQDLWQQTVAMPPLFTPQRGLQEKPQAASQWDIQIEASTLARWQQQAERHARLNLEEFLLMGLANALCDFAATDQVCIYRESHGRAGDAAKLDLSRTVGWFTSLYPQRLDRQGSLAETLRCQKEQLRGAAHGGLGFGILQQRGELSTAAGDRPRDVLFNYLGQFRHEGLPGVSVTEAGLWQEADAPADAALAINAEQREGQLRLRIETDGVRLSREQGEALVQQWLQQCEQLARHCEHHEPVLTPSDVPLSTLSQAELDALPARPEQVLPLSPLQAGLLFHSQLSASSRTYVNQLVLPVTGLNPRRFRQAWQAMLERHDVLRTGLLPAHACAGERHQAVWSAQQVSLCWQETDLRDAGDDAAASFCEQRLSEGFDLEAAPLWRVDLLQLGEDRWESVLTLHHLLMDGWSTGVMLTELLALYHQMPLPPAPLQYVDYLHWLHRQDRAATQAFWQEYLAPVQAPTRLVDAVGTSEKGEFRRNPITFDAATSDRLRQAARDQGLTINTLVQAAWARVLGRFTGQQRVVFGNTVAGRPADLAGSDAMLGLFINTLPMTVSLAGDQPLASWLAALQADNAALREHGHAPLFDVQQDAGWGGESLFDTLLVFENYPLDERLLGSGQQTLTLGTPRSHEFTHYPLTVAVLPGDQLDMLFAHDTAALPIPLVDRLASQFRDTLLMLAEQGGEETALLATLDALGSDEAILQQWGEGEGAYAAQSFPALFSQQAALRGGATALVHGDTRVSFAELEARSNRLARYLVEQGVSADEVVGVSFARGVTMIEAFLAVMKAGGAFLPLDPGYPTDRLHYMLEDSGARLLLTSSDLAETLPQVEGVSPVFVDQLSLANTDGGSLNNEPNPDQLAYVIYTSGSTGKPKGVALTHGGLSMHVQTIGERYGMTPEDVELQFASISFDGAVERWTVPLAFGSRVVIRDQALWSAEKCCEVLQQEGVTIACFPPSYVGPLLDWIEQEKPALKVRSWTLGGEAFTRETFERMQQVLKPQRIINGYGPTETVVTPMLWAAYEGDSLTSAYAPIGTAVGPRKLYVLDQDLNRVPAGVAGELYIGNEVGLARGYHDRPDLTAERFLPDPFGEAGERMYRTGDLVKFRDDGVMEYLGRVDQQVKIRGFRIELGEIESRLQAFDSIREAAVVAQPSPTGDRLVGYIVPRHTVGAALESRTLLESLSLALPDYMVPSQLITLEHLPLTPAGKVDRKALPEPQWQTASAGDAPQTDNEKILATIWQKLLGLEAVSRDDHFFNLGGHSLLAVQMVNRLRHQHQLDLPLNRIFEQPLLKQCAALCQSAAALPAIRPVARGGDLPCSAAQRRLWFVQQLQPENGAYHMPLGLDVRGELHRAALQQALDALVANHESLRTRFVETAGEPRQRILDEAPVIIDWQDLTGEVLPESVARELQESTLSAPFNLASDPLLRVQVIQLAPQRYQLLLVQHHIIGDGVSMQLLMAELSSRYAQAHRGDAMPLVSAQPSARIQYADYAAWQQQWLASDEARAQQQWWVEQLGEGGEPLALPTDFPRGVLVDAQPANSKEGGARLPVTFSHDQLERLKQRATELGSTVSTLLLTAWQVLLHRYSGQSQVRVGVPVAGRLLAETETLQGCFINTLVVPADFVGSQSLAEQVAATQQFIGEAQGRQALPFEVLVEALGVDRNLDRHPLFQVVFNHQRLSENFAPQWPEAVITPFDPGAAGAQFELALDVLEDDEQLQGFIGYDTALFRASTIERLREHFLRVMTALLTQPDQSLSDIALLSDQEQADQQVFNRTEKRWGDFVAVPERVRQQAVRSPEAVALSMGDKQLSYAELDRKVNQLANRLRAAGVKEEVRVAIGLPRSLDLVIGLLAITRAGGAYVPLDPSYPQDRLAYILEASQPALLLTDSRLLDSWPQAVPMWCLDQLDVSGQATTAPSVQWHPDQALYVIYTSGSTGKPKGVLNTQAALENRLLWMQQQYPLDESDCVLQKTPFSFDVSVWEFFWPLMVGARLAIAPPDAHADPQWLQQVMAEEQVTTLHFVPSMLHAFVSATGLKNLPSLKQVICSGEALDMALQGSVFAARDDVQLHNLYGPTEAAIDVSYWHCRQGTGHTVPIGSPISNIQLHVLDTDLNPVPRGVAGELYLAGVGLARGYHGRPDLTAERFVPNPFGEPGSRMYRTGDQVVQRADGVIDYLGRLDHQVKIRGLRIELGEIEQQLKQQPDIEDAVVVAHSGAAGDQLVAYVVSDASSPEAWQQALSAALPDYMVPGLFMMLEQMPLSPNGKLDRKALPEPQWQAREYRAPVTDTEQQLAALWEELLGLSLAKESLSGEALSGSGAVGLDDNFFALGGHSLLATRVVAALRDRWGVDVPLRALFETDTLQALAALVDEHNGEAKQQEQDDLAAMADLLDDLEDL